MKAIKFLFALFVALIVGFLYAGILGSAVFGIILSLTISYIKRQFNLSTFLLRTFVFSITAYTLMFFFGLLNADKDVHVKVDKIRDKLIALGYSPKWVIISQKRNVIYNNLLYNSVKNGKSKHLTGKAIDLYVFDINGDWVYDSKDFEIIQKASNKIDKEDPHSKCQVIHYLTKGKFSKRMVHIEIF